MDQATRTRLELNIFPAAHQACEPWEKFAWQTKAHLAHSSQAMAIDIFGTIKTSANQDAIMDALAQTLGLPTGGPWDITLEWAARSSLLNEPSPTQVDVYAESPQSIMVFECTLAEPDGGACPQTMKRKGAESCDGNYEENGTQEQDLTGRCVLSDKGIQYWDIIPKAFHLEAEAEYQPCPFAGSSYQWMRKLVVAYKVGRQKNKQPAVVMVYADHSDLSMAQKVKSKAWTLFTETVRQEHVSLHVRSYQEILTLAQKVTHQHSEEPPLWQELREWVERKISAISSDRNSDRKKPPKKRATSSSRMAANRNG
ncbi:MAG: hypothetical protein OEY57_13325 [Nitrospirota bacterium]|nr:hypothetical protein [Nitrospirota bacterium]